MPSLIPLLTLFGSVSAISYDIDSASSVAAAGKTVVQSILALYPGNQRGQTPGLFQYPPYFWWESGVTFGHLVDYVYYTGDTEYNTLIKNAVQWQGGMNGQFFPSNQSYDMGNDDQVYWTYTAMNAAEQNFPEPDSGYPTWAAMCDIVFNEQLARWDPTTCHGGLHWQVYSTNPGYDYFNLAANGGFFLLAARLARYDQSNSTYLEWAEKMWDWLENYSYSIDKTNPTAWKVWDGTQDAGGAVGGCTGPDKAVWTYNYGALFTGCAYLWNATGDDKWLTAVYGIMNGTIDLFFNNPEKVITEPACEPENTCQTNPNWTVFKGVTIRWMATVTQLVPQLADTLWPYLDASAKGAAAQCDGNGGSTCGYHWTTSTWDGSTGLGQDITALAGIMTPMIQLRNLAAPLTLKTGATSNTNTSANGANVGEQNSDTPGWVGQPITTGDKAGASIITIILVCTTVAGAYWMAKA